MLNQALNNKSPRFIVAALGITLAVGIVAGGVFMPTKAQHVMADTASVCPAGSYLIGYDKDDERVPVCKANPTGCPYGDSIPMSECDKFAPAASDKSEADLPDPDRPYYDGQGNQFTHDGKPISQAPQQPAAPTCKQ